jgi:hypothetical protein
VTTAPLQDPINLRAFLFQGSRLLAIVRCRLSPAEAPAYGMALVPDDRDWLALGPLTLLLQRSGQRYEIVPTKVEPAAGLPSLLRFRVAP